MIAIARLWNGTVPRRHADGFYQHLLATGVNEAQTVDGYLGATVVRTSDEDTVTFTLTTFWKDIEAMRKFGTADKAVLYPGDERFELLPDLSVTVGSLIYNDDGGNTR